MTSQLRHYFQASQAMHGADDVTTLLESGQCSGPQVDTLINREGCSAQPY